MKAIFISAYSFEEQSSSSHLGKDIMSCAKSAGFEIVFITPNPVRGLSKEAVKANKKSFEKQEDYGLHVSLSSPSMKESNPAFRFLRYRVFIRKALAWVKRQSDVAFLFFWSYPPFVFSGPVASFKKRTKVRVIYNVHDIYPEIITKKGGWKYRLLNRPCLKMIRSADILATLSEDMKDTLVSKGASRESVHVISPWSYPPSGEVSGQDLLNRLGVDPTQKNVFYIGNLGKFQNMDLLFGAAQIVGDKDPSIHFHLVGSGRLAEGAAARSESQTNLTVHGRVSAEEAQLLYTLADLNLITLCPGVIANACPSKTPLCVESGRPYVVAVGDSKYQAALSQDPLCVVSGTANESLADAIVAYFAGEPKRREPTFGSTRGRAIDSWTNIFREVLNHAK